MIKDDYDGRAESVSVRKYCGLGLNIGPHFNNFDIGCAEKN